MCLMYRVKQVSFLPDFPESCSMCQSSDSHRGWETGNAFAQGILYFRLLFMLGSSCLSLGLLMSGFYPQGRTVLFLACSLPKVGRSRDSGLRVLPDLSSMRCRSSGDWHSVGRGLCVLSRGAPSSSRAAFRLPSYSRTPGQRGGSGTGTWLRILP